MDENTPDEEGFVFVRDSHRNKLFKARECDGDIILCFQLKNRNEGERDVYLYKSEMDYQMENGPSPAARWCLMSR